MSETTIAAYLSVRNDDRNQNEKKNERTKRNRLYMRNTRLYIHSKINDVENILNCFEMVDTIKKIRDDLFFV